jgi:hypothetical protein
MTDFPLDQELIVRDGRGQILRTVEDARTFVRDVLKQRPSAKWQAVFRRLDSVHTKEDAAEAADAVRELLESEGVLVARRTSAPGQ